jgi:hypothetical protein
VPGIVCDKARPFGGEAWLEELPALVERLERDWGIAPGETYPDSNRGVPRQRGGRSPFCGSSATRLGLEPVGSQMLAAADALSG